MCASVGSPFKTWQECAPPLSFCRVSLRYFASRGPLRSFGFASLRQPDNFVAGASRLCVEINSSF